MFVFFYRKRVFQVLCILAVVVLVMVQKHSSDKTLSEGIMNEISHLKEATLAETAALQRNFEGDAGRKGAGGGGGDNDVDDEKQTLEPCTIVNPLTNQFYDLRPLSSLGNDGEVQTWNSKGFDYGKNFSIGICSTPMRQLKALKESDFVDTHNKSLVGGYYTDREGKKVSIGEYSTELKFRGLNLVLEYSNGDRCEESPNLFKSTLLTFRCDREMMSKARVNFLGSLNNCSYLFEVRTVHACATANDENDNAIWGIFLLILCSAVGVYLFAGVMYRIIQRHYERSVKKQHTIV